MSSGHALLAVGGAFLAAGVIARAGARIGLPTIPLFMLAGFVFGPNTPGLSLVDDPAELGVLAGLGLVFLLFYLGLEFSLDDLAKGGRKLVWSGLIYLILNIGGGLAFGFLLGWGTREALVIAGAIGISSSAIVTKLLLESRRMNNPESRLIMGIIVIEDIFLALYLALLQPVLSGAGSFGSALADFGKAFAFLIVMAALARWGGRVVSKLFGSADDELLTVCFVGVAVMGAAVAEEVGVSDAIGAFMVGMMLGGSKVAPRIHKLVLPLRDAFGALFFFIFGLSIDPNAVGSVVVPVLIAVALTIVLNLGAGALAARVNGFDRQAGVNIGLTVLTRGEFSLVLAAMATAAGLDSRVAPFVAGYVLLLAVIGPVAVIRSEKLAWLLPASIVRGATRRDEPARAT
ncbi:cation:proton antiporter [Amycolatopsis keratiniphila]|uniref:Cation/H(+) antiporter n=1 Tax=Amycolatopsis keratiniphila subsp. keratiniphila TaxID=227715 RepID=A0A1W2LVB5_9PSEU|nr:cation:proton antiporter [Amycolatopsis keratiniphila]OLZ44185.1 cation/H(+) antiporter [Amycolatopsis keratiniphila subsp. nogabecina]ONF70266.1 cation/H(+) antiporter [Amycolatopsis keratiniphila subsp. keratiniphila]SDU42507.1 potassium/proton antiporter membrane subunit, CPA2 family [Amycolatopsis keratiniphila]